MPNHTGQQRWERTPDGGRRSYLLSLRRIMRDKENSAALRLEATKLYGLAIGENVPVRMKKDKTVEEVLPSEGLQRLMANVEEVKPS